MSDINALLSKEITTINRLLQAHHIQAATAPGRTIATTVSFIAYGLKIAPGQSIRDIEAIHREMSNELARGRLQYGYRGPCPVRVRDYPLAIEVPHPDPKPLDWRQANLKGRPYQAVIGRSYHFTGTVSEIIDLERDYHMLVAAQSGAGKSTLMRMALATLAMSTPPSALRIMLVDLKADDLVPFRRMPHVISLAANVEQAAAAIRQVHDLRDARIAGERRDYRLLLVIDELAELAESKEVLAQLGRILPTGRSLGINVWAGTQYPTAAAIGSIVSRSFTTRVVGRVDGARAAQVATQRSGSYAHHLAHPGDFLRVDGADMIRLKAFHVTGEIASQLINGVVEHWGATSAPVLQQPMAPAPASEAAHAADEIASIADTIRPLWEQDASLAAMIRAVYGPTANTGGSNRTNVLKAIERLNNASGGAKIIQLRRAAGD